jgi:sarcosine oxidase
VVGAGVFGAWTAHQLRKSGRSVALLDAYGAANGRASSGGESRILRMGYGPNEVYTRWAQRSRTLWLDLFDRVSRPDLFVETGVLWTTPAGDSSAVTTRAAFDKCGVNYQALDAAEMMKRWPQIQFASNETGTFEPEAGTLLARRAVRAVVEASVLDGADYFREGALPPDGDGVKTLSGRRLSAEIIVYACGPWLPKVFPHLLANRIRPTRQEVFFFGCPPGERAFTPPEMPAWIDFSDKRGPYCVPDVENRGFKLAFDRHGPVIDPDSTDRVVSGLAEARAFLAERFPRLASAPLVDSRVCQYECTSSGDFLIDRHPDFNNVWLVGGGSGHGFKHGPMVGEYATGLIDRNIASEARFSLATKASEPQREIF